MSITRWLAASIVANVVLVGLVAARYSQSDQHVEEFSPSAPEASAVADSAADTRVPAATEPVVRAPFDPDKALVLARLEHEAREANPPPRADYWRSGDAEFAQYEEIAEQQREGIRRQLLAQYGPSAMDDPAFTRLFRPMNATHAYLSSKAQIALAKLQRTRRNSAPAHVAGLSPGLIGGPGAALEQQQAFDEEVRRALGNEYREYQLRSSPLARQLRGTGVIESDRQFREVFAALEQLGSGASAETHTRVQGQLQALLGETRYAQFSAARDPAFPAMQAAGARRQLSREQILSAYAVVVRAQNELIASTIERGAAGTARPGAEPQQIVEARDAEIARLVGEPAATEMLQAHSNGMVAASLQVMNAAR